MPYLFDYLLPSSSFNAMTTFGDQNLPQLSGSAGSLLVLPDDEITLNLAMLFEGQCEGSRPKRKGDL